MRKILFIFLLMAGLGSVKAQNYKNDGKSYAFYCQIVGMANLSGQLRLQIIWDDIKHNLRDENGGKIEFFTMTEAMNYMSKRGWDYVDCVAYQEGKNNVFQYIFRKYITKDEEAKDGLYFETDFMIH